MGQQRQEPFACSLIDSSLHSVEHLGIQLKKAVDFLPFFFSQYLQFTMHYFSSIEGKLLFSSFCTCIYTELLTF